MLKRDRMREWYPKSQQIRRRYLTPYEHKAIKHLVRENGETMADVARLFRVNYSTVTGILQGRKKPWKPSGAAVKGRRLQQRSKPADKPTEIGGTA